MDQPKPFRGIRVVDLSTRFSGAFAARLFGDFGAEVVLAEPLTGSSLRREPPFVRSESDSIDSIVHAFVNWNKHSVVIDSDAALNALLKSADVVITTSFDTDFLARVQSHFAQDAVHLSITAHGLHGPLQHAPGNNLTLSAQCGWASVNSYRDEPPLSLPRNQNGIVGGVTGYIAAAAALRCRVSQQTAECVDVSELEALALTVHPWGVAAVYNGFAATRGPGGGRLRGAPGPLWNLADGRMNLGLADFHNWTAAMNACGLPAQGLRPELIPDFGRHSQDLRDVVHGLAESLPKLERWPVFHALAKLRCVIGVVQDIADLVQNEHLLARKYFARTKVGVKDVRVSGAPAKLSPSPWAIHRTAPRIGEHETRSNVNRAVTHTTLTTEAATQSRRTGPLAGVRVLSFGQAWSGTFATELLALLGADVVQVASVKHPDAFRRISNKVPRGVHDPSRKQHPPNTQGHYNSVNLHKREIDLDLTQPNGQDILWQLIPRFDMLVDNFRPTVLPKWGVTLERLHELRPGMIWASISGYGESGPYSHYPANGATTEPMSGLASIHGYRGDQSMNTGGLYPDPISGYFLVATILAAMRHRDLTGEPQRIDLSMMEAVSSTIGDAVMLYDATAAVPTPRGNEHPHHAPYGMYQAAGSDWIAIAVETDEMWQSFLRVVDDERLLNPDFAKESYRKERQEELERVVAEWAIGQHAEEAVQRLRNEGICAARVAPLRELYNKPDLVFKEAGFIQQIKHPEAGTTWLPGRPWRYSSLGSPKIEPAPCVGQHSQEVFENELGISSEDYAILVQDAITGTLDERGRN